MAVRYKSTDREGQERSAEEEQPLPVHVETAGPFECRPTAQLHATLGLHLPHGGFLVFGQRVMVCVVRVRGVGRAGRRDGKEGEEHEERKEKTGDGLSEPSACAEF